MQQGSQAPLEIAEGVGPPKYGYARSNVWPSYMPRPKRLPKDDVPTCDCLPSSAPTTGGSSGRSLPCQSSPQIPERYLHLHCRHRRPAE